MGLLENARRVTRNVTLREIPGRGWLYKEHGVYFASLGHAIRMVNADNKAIAKNGNVVVYTLLTYEPVTRAGTLIVKFHAEALAAA